MNEKIKKLIYNKLSSLPDNKVLLFPDLEIAFSTETGKSLNDHSDVLENVAEDLEKSGFARFEQAPNGTLRILKGIDFDKWDKEMKSDSSGSVTFNIGKIEGQNIQVGNENVQNIEIGIKSLIEVVNNANIPDAEKATAKNKIKDLLENPTIAAALGGIASGLLGLL